MKFGYTFFISVRYRLFCWMPLPTFTFLDTQEGGLNPMASGPYKSDPRALMKHRGLLFNQRAPSARLNGPFRGIVRWRGEEAETIPVKFVQARQLFDESEPMREWVLQEEWQDVLEESDDCAELIS